MEKYLVNRQCMSLIVSGGFEVCDGWCRKKLLYFPLCASLCLGMDGTYNGFFTNFLTDISLISDIQ